jgi:hypothetical protein
MLKKINWISCGFALCAGLLGSNAMAFDFQNTKPSADQPIRVDTSKAPEDAFASLSPSAGKMPAPSRASLIMNIPNASYWTPYVGAGAGVRSDPLDFNSSQADYNFLAGTMLQTDPDKKGRQHQLTLGYRFNESTDLYSSPASLSREPSHNLEVDWRFRF